MSQDMPDTFASHIVTAVADLEALADSPASAMITSTDEGKPIYPRGLVDKIVDHKLKVPRGDRSGAVLEPYLTDQWFVDLTRETRHDGKAGKGGLLAITKPAIDAVESGRIRFVPDNWKTTYFHWLNNIQDWCISRQLWWGHRIPAWYDEAGNVVPESAERLPVVLPEDVAWEGVNSPLRSMPAFTQATLPVNEPMKFSSTLFLESDD